MNRSTQLHFREHTPALKQKIGEITRKARKEAGLSVRGFAKGMGATGQSVTNWERAISLPEPYLFFYAAEAEGVWARWAVDCIHALGLVDGLINLANLAALTRDVMQLSE